MNRIGLNADNIKQCENDIRELSKKLILTGLFTHLSVADNSAEKDGNQLFQ